MNKLSPLSFALLLLLIPSFYAQPRAEREGANSQRRVALVIGNSAYKIGPLKNPINDAYDVAQALRGLGFDVIYRENVKQDGMKRAIRIFGEQLRGGGIGLFYYAGHGVQVKGVNYLVPVDAMVETEEEVEYECVDAGFALAQMESAGNSMNIVILDACRNNPFARSFRRSASRGLAQMDAPSGTLIAYATAPGSVASDGNARNGIYTQELLKFMRVPDIGIEEVFKRVRISVRNLTQRKQTPWESSSLIGDFYFARANTLSPGLPPSPNPTRSPEQALLPSITRTEWKFMDEIYAGESDRMVFQEGGKLSFYYAGLSAKGNWEQKGNTIRATASSDSNNSWWFNCLVRGNQINGTWDLISAGRGSGRRFKAIKVE